MRSFHPRQLWAITLLGLALATAPAVAQVQQAGRLQGSVVDSRGTALPGAQVVADNTLFFNTNVIGVSDAQGRFNLDVSRPVGTWVASATLTRQFNGKRYVVSLDPDTDAPFAGDDGAIRRFTWKLSGERRDGLGPYGMSVIYYLDITQFEDPHFPGDFLDPMHVELTLEPVGPLIDGSQGRSIVAMGRNTPDGPALIDVPIGRYAISGRYLSPGRPVRRMEFRVRNTGDYVPTLTTDFEEVLQTLYHITLDARIDISHVHSDSFESQTG